MADNIEFLTVIHGLATSSAEVVDELDSFVLQLQASFPGTEDFQVLMVKAAALLTVQSKLIAKFAEEQLTVEDKLDDVLKKRT